MDTMMLVFPITNTDMAHLRGFSGARSLYPPTASFPLAPHVLEWFVRLRFPGREHTRIINGVPEGWKQERLASACESAEDGDWIESKDQDGDDFRLLQISNIGMNEFVETGNFRGVSEETFRRLNCRSVDPGDILISRMPKPIGRAWLVTEMPWRMVTAVDVTILKPNDSRLDRYFLLYHLNSESHLGHCERRLRAQLAPGSLSVTWFLCL